jgi:hypothetical protein
MVNGHSTAELRATRRMPDAGRPSAAAPHRLRHSSRLERIVLIVGYLLATASGVVAWHVAGPYGLRTAHDPRVQRGYDPSTGRVTMVAFDADGDLRIDRWCLMDGERLLRMDADDDADGVPDRRSYYGPGERLLRTEYLDHGRVVRTEVVDSSTGSQ